ncbi:MAG: glutathione S-transferase N-terminal domain-containing protein [Alphaproteobacteria bacterium]
MRLWYSPTSPYVRKVMVTAAEKGLAARIETIAARAPENDIAARNPLGKVPTLETDDGDILYESTIICEYLDSLAGGVELYPSSGKARWQALMLQGLADGVDDAAILIRMEGRRADAEKSAWWVERQAAKVARGLDALELEAAGFGADINIGHIATACMLGFAELHDLAGDWRPGHPTLAKWYDEFCLRPSMTASDPKNA